MRSTREADGAAAVSQDHDGYVATEEWKEGARAATGSSARAALFQRIEGDRAAIQGLPMAHAHERSRVQFF
jgi:predicted house-cleaning NTP pyrophosphatase (Maf/HAM1 superfamily)